MSIYKTEIDGTMFDLRLKEQMLYGSSRLGMVERDVKIGSNSSLPSQYASNNNSGITFDTFDPQNPPTETTFDNPFADDDYSEQHYRIYGERKYELGNHPAPQDLQSCGFK